MTTPVAKGKSTEFRDVQLRPHLDIAIVTSRNAHKRLQHVIEGTDITVIVFPGIPRHNASTLWTKLSSVTQSHAREQNKIAEQGQTSDHLYPFNIV